MLTDSELMNMAIDAAKKILNQLEVEDPRQPKVSGPIYLSGGMEAYFRIQFFNLHRTRSNRLFNSIAQITLSNHPEKGWQPEKGTLIEMQEDSHNFVFDNNKPLRVPSIQT